MNTNREHIATAAELARLDFVPWPNDALESMRRTVIDGLTDPDKVQISIASRINCKSKSAVMDVARKAIEADQLGEEGNDVMTMAEHLHTAADYFRAVAEFIDSAEIRLMAAAAAVELGEKHRKA